LPPPPNSVTHCDRPWPFEESLFLLSALSKSNPRSLSSSLLGAHPPSDSSCCRRRRLVTLSK
ncbi:hypothetical protein HN51_029813, partial [Arachis hypogaea]